MSKHPDPYQTFRDDKETDYVKELVDLLCVLHRDGGHHINNVGIKQAIKDAHQVFYKMRDQITIIDSCSKEQVQVDDTLACHYGKI